MVLVACIVGMTGTSLATPAKPAREVTKAHAHITYGVVQPGGSDPAEAVGAGFQAVVVQSDWSALQPTGSGSVDPAAVADLRSRIASAHQAGLAVVLELALQYPPPWALRSIPAFEDQTGQAYDAPSSPGMDVRDWVWTKVGRAAVADLISRTLAQLGSSVLAGIQRVRLGGGYYDELHYPPVGAGANPSWWSYGACQMPASERAPDEAACPVRGFSPARLGSWSAASQAYASWHMHGLTVFMSWLIGQYRGAGYTGPISVLTPGFGLRSDDDPTLTDWRGTAYRELAAEGLDWVDQVSTYAQLPQVYPWSTWLDEPDPHQPFTRDSDEAGWRKLAEIARAYGRGGDMWGENTDAGGSGDARVPRANAAAAGYAGVMLFTTDETLAPAGAGAAAASLVLRAH